MNNQFDINEFITQPIEGERHYHNASYELDHLYPNRVEWLGLPDDFKINKSPQKIQYHTKDMTKVRRKQKLAKKAKRNNRKK